MPPTQAMSERYHPIGECVHMKLLFINSAPKFWNYPCPIVYSDAGEHFKNVKYKDVYKWFNCMQVDHSSN